MSPLPATATRVLLEELKVGPLLAEGGEGRVFQLPRQPHLLFKSFRDRHPRDHLDSLVGWPDTLPPGPSGLVRQDAAWSCAVVDNGGENPAGLLVPRAPRRFSVRHRDGHSRLASLSYLTADPGHRAAAYGLDLPVPAGAARLGLVHALARLLAAFEAAPNPVGHGDLSTKNVLWSLLRGPEVFVIDCDNAEIFDPGGPEGAAVPGRRRAMTPNWDDPAVRRGGNPTLASDRYSLALIFLRVVGAANFPIQARQRAGGPVRVEFPVPPGPGDDVLLDPSAPVWALCSRSLDVADPAARPSAAAWSAELERILEAMGARPAGAGRGGEKVETVEAVTDDADLVVVPVRGEPRSDRAWARVSPNPRYGAAPPPGPGGAGGFGWTPQVPGTFPAAAGAGSPPGPGGGQVVTGVAVWPEVKSVAGRMVRWWAARHAAVLRALLTPGRRSRGVRYLILVAVMDLALLAVVVVFGAMFSAPALGL